MNENGLFMAVGRQRNLEQRVIQVAKDLGNVNTPGHKAKHLVETVNTQKTGFNQHLNYAENKGFVVDAQQGAFMPTGDPLHMAIIGDGHFSVQATVEGQQVAAYTRDGVFTRGVDGVLQTASGAAVLDEGGAQIFIPAGMGPLSVSADGTITHGDVVVGRVGVVQFPSNNLMQEIGNNLYITAQDPQEPTKFRIESGGYESSTVNPVDATTELMSILRSYEHLENFNKTFFRNMKTATDNLMVSAPAA